MKLTIDTDRKVIEIDEAINLKDLVNGLKKLLGDEWDEYSIVQRTGYTYWPWYPPYVTYTDNPTPVYVDYNTPMTSLTPYEN